MFKSTFTPSVNKVGESKLTFVKLEILEGKAGEVSARTGEIYQKDWIISNLVFSVKGMIKGTSQDIKVPISLKYAPDNTLGKILNGLGYLPPSLETTEDEDGFEVVVTEEDSDEFAEVPDMNLGIEDFLNSIVGKNYAGKVLRASEGKNKGQWIVDINTIRPL